MIIIVEEKTKYVEKKGSENPYITSNCISFMTLISIAKTSILFISSQSCPGFSSSITAICINYGHARVSELRYALNASTALNFTFTKERWL